MEDVDVIEGVPVAMIYPCAEWGASGGSSRTFEYIISPSGYRASSLSLDRKASIPNAIFNSFNNL